jgi:putative ABC transport system permease protein
MRRATTQWLPNAENTYQFQTHYQDRQTGREAMAADGEPMSPGKALKKDFPQVEHGLRAERPGDPKAAPRLSTDKVLFVDNLFFDVLQFPFAAGDPRTALSRPTMSC